MPYLSELERGRKEASSEVLAAAAHALGLGLADLLARAHGELVRRAPPGGLRAPRAAVPRLRAARRACAWPPEAAGSAGRRRSDPRQSPAQHLVGEAVRHGLLRR